MIFFGKPVSTFPDHALAPTRHSMAWKVAPHGTKPSRFTRKTKVSSKAASQQETLVAPSLMLWRQQGKAGDVPQGHWAWFGRIKPAV
jgi:hypothetical protein